MPRQPFSSFHREKKFYVAVSRHGLAGSGMTFLNGRRAVTDVFKAQRFYSKAAAAKLIKDTSPNPNMNFQVSKARETEKGIDVYF